MTITYKLDGVDLINYNVYISASDGLLSRPKPKENMAVNWPDYNGTVVDLTKRLYEAREIELSCFIKAESQQEFIKMCNNFLALFDKTGTRRLEVFVDYEVTPKPLTYEVYLADEVNVSKKWNMATMVGTFKIKLMEPEPIKRVFKYTRYSDATKTASLTLTSSKLLNVYWGDGSHTFDASGTAQTLTHNYTEDGTYYIVITGNIDEITSLTSNGILVWNKL